MTEGPGPSVILSAEWYLSKTLDPVKQGVAVDIVRHVPAHTVGHGAVGRKLCKDLRLQFGYTHLLVGDTRFCALRFDDGLGCLCRLLLKLLLHSLVLPALSALGNPDFAAVGADFQMDISIFCVHDRARKRAAIAAVTPEIKDSGGVCIVDGDDQIPAGIGVGSRRELELAVLAPGQSIFPGRREASDPRSFRPSMPNSEP